MPERDYEIVKYHTRQKHALLKAYLRVWTEHVGRNKGRQAPSLSLVDLFAGKGWCKDEESGETWPGTGAMLAKCMSIYPSQYPLKLLLNSYNPESEEQQTAQVQALESAIQEFDIPSNCDVKITHKEVEGAVTDAEQFFNRDFPSIWVLDPYKPQQLPWSVVEQVAKIEGEHYPRRPEMFINFMTFALQENVNHNPHIVSKALGLDEDEWRPRLDALVSLGNNTREALRDIYAARLEELYGRPVHWIEVDGVQGNIVYVLFLCTDNDAGFYMLNRLSIPKFNDWRVGRWQHKAKEIAASRKVNRKASQSGHEQSRLFGEEE